jgi:hypothetical protein
LEDVQRTSLQPRASIQREHQARHKEWPQGESAMFAFVARQISSSQAIRQHHRLAEGETEAFSSNGIHRPGRVPN